MLKNIVDTIIPLQLLAQKFSVAAIKQLQQQAQKYSLQEITGHFHIIGKKMPMRFLVDCMPSVKTILKEWN